MNGDNGGAMLAAADMRLFNVYSSAFLAKKGSIDIARPPCIRFVLPTSLKVTRKPIIKIKSVGSKKCVFICHSTFSTIIAM